MICIKIIKNVLMLSVNRSVLNNNLSAKAATTAKIIFEIGPAAATYTISCFGFSKYLESTGTGFAQPNPINNNANEPTGSK